MLIVNNDNRMIHQYQIDVHQSYVKPFQHDYLFFKKIKFKGGETKKNNIESVNEIQQKINNYKKIILLHLVINESISINNNKI